MAISIEPFFAATTHTFLHDFHPQLKLKLEQHYQKRSHGRTPEWDKALAQLPNTKTSNIHLNQARISLSLPESLSLTPEQITEHLKVFKPWRKGPWHYCGVNIDTEWRSDWKWQRIIPHISSLAGRNVLDIGCGNGYFLYRMLGEGAKLAIGVDPTRVFLYQFHCMQRLMANTQAHILPLRSEHLPAFKAFDTVFCLGVLYHRRSPIEQMQELMSFLKPSGELVLETLVVPGDASTTLVPKDRYAKMANVWFLPSTDALENLLHRTGFNNIRTVDINKTSINEQQTTKWMDFNSLAQFLDPKNPDLTAEGYPAPRRATVIANA